MPQKRSTAQGTLLDSPLVDIATWGFVNGQFMKVGSMEINKKSPPPFANSHAVKIDYISKGDARTWLVFTYQNDLEISKQKIRDKWRALRAQGLTPTSAAIESPAGGILWEHKDK